MRTSTLKCTFTTQRTYHKSKLWVETNTIKFIGNKGKPLHVGTNCSLIDTYRETV